MFKDSQKTILQQQLGQDLQFMLSSIRARENCLIFFLQRFKSYRKSLIKQSQTQYQQKQKIYTRQIHSIILKHGQFSDGNLYSIKTFWIKLKTIIKVSIQRIQMHNIQGMDKLYHCYQKALDIINRNQHMERGLVAYKEVQNLLKRRNIQMLLITKASLSPTSISFSQSKIQKNRSQTLFKPDSAISRFTVDNQQTIMSNGANERDRYGKLQYLNGLQDIQQEKTNKQDLKTKSMNRIKARRPEQDIKSNILNFIKVQRLGKLKSSSKASQKCLKKINKHVDRYEKNFEGAFDGKYDIQNLIDKKKTIYQNIYSLYDNLFAKNIPNHKIISKFMFNTTKINQILYNAYEKKKKTIKKDKQKTAQTKQKDKKQTKQKQTNDQKQKLITKITKNGRKLHSLKDATSQHTNIRSGKQVQKQKPYSQTTAITLNLNRGQPNLMSNFINMNEYKQKQKNKQKKILRSKTAKVKLNSQGNIQPAISAQARHMVSYHQKDQKDHKEKASKYNIAA